jgi:aldehyde:ferredoxin oxidoreductase
LEEHLADIIINNLRTKKIITIKNCIECPLACIEFTDVYCTGKDKRKHTYIGLVSQVMMDTVPPICPLPEQVLIKDA